MRSIIIILLLLICSQVQAGLLVDHRAPQAFEAIPADVYATIRSTQKIFYGHTSHGSQLITGMEALKRVDWNFYEKPTITEVLDDLGEIGEIAKPEWIQTTRNWLDAHPDYNVVMWAWCGGMTTNTIEGVNFYLSNMSQLELDYPDVTFIYQTGHLDGTGVNGTLYRNNNLVRDYCAANDKILYDFADIESWDPAGTYYPDETDACYWCVDWCGTADCCPGDLYCAHSHCFNCDQKGKAFWWTLARLTGWGVVQSSVQGVRSGALPQYSEVDILGCVVSSVRPGYGFSCTELPAGPYSAIWVRTTAALSIVAGSTVDLFSAEYTTVDGMGLLDMDTYSGQVSITGTTALPEISLAITDLRADDAAWQGHVLKLTDKFRIIAADPASGELTAQDTVDDQELMLDDYFQDYSALPVDQCFRTVEGLYVFTDSEYKMEALPGTVATIDCDISSNTNIGFGELKTRYR